MVSISSLIKLTNGGKAYLESSCQPLDFPQSKREERLPGPKREKETKPSECENTSVNVERVQSRDGTGLAIDWIDHRGRPQSCRVEHLEARDKVWLNSSLEAGETIFSLCTRNDRQVGSVQDSYTTQFKASVNIWCPATPSGQLASPLCISPEAKVHPPSSKSAGCLDISRL